MTNHVLLNNVDHKDIRVITERSAKYGDDMQCDVTFCWEFRNIQAHYPIFFMKGAQAEEFNAVAVFGFEENENLFLDDSGWDANHIPLTIQRQPFLIGFQEAATGANKEPVIHIDMDSPRVSKTEGEALFESHGGVSDFLDRVNSVLNTINEGYEVHQLFMKDLVELDLLEPFALDIELQDGSQNRLMGFYTIHEERLAALDGDVLAKLNEKGFLLPIYMSVASLSNIRALIDRKNAKMGL